MIGGGGRRVGEKMGRPKVAPRGCGARCGTSSTHSIFCNGKWASVEFIVALLCSATPDQIRSAYFGMELMPISADQLKSN